MDQDNFILKHCSSLQPRRVKGESNRKREFTVKYFATKAVSSSIRIPKYIDSLELSVDITNLVLQPKKVEMETGKQRNLLRKKRK